MSIKTWALGTLGAIALAGGCGVYGYVQGKATADVKLAQYGEQAALKYANYEKRLGEKQIQIVTQTIEHWNTIREREKTNVEQAKSAVPSQYVLSNGWVYLHDSAATNAEADRTRSSDASPSGVADNRALATVTVNYARFHECVVQVKALQSLIAEHNNAIDEANKAKKDD